MIQSIRYSLFCYSSVPCSLEPIPQTYKYYRNVRDSWTSNTCGGSCNQINTFRLNPQYLISLPNTNNINNINNINHHHSHSHGNNRSNSPHTTLFDKTNLRFSLSCLQPLDINIMVFCNQGQPIHLPAKELMITSTGNYRRCFSMCKLSSQELTYFQKDFTHSIFPLTVVLSNFSGSLGDFEFRVESTHTLIELKKIV
ncbi:predicted protein [Naegleria gruberi]|uniref:Predicted protein n=1 Tax=Naegleria gruberi TaxID=5762 RepID=D2W694_NAEGR|nr:uncharacterized protein NAEGRDRAFT_76937 [Naegleria gruberi]EFC35409.1 predicted protein [Naegleria gruberi]|eukprot:XP_002668153.1 predicted protein [Naegleria gruberi strain NEG-M]